MRRILGALLAAAVLAVAGCSAGTAGGDTGGVISVTGATGTIHLKKPATKVVALEWSSVEELLTLGVTPVGVADKATYGTWVTAGPRLPGSVTDVGKRAQPSLEQIKALQPDLIVAESSRVTANLDQLRQIAPVLAFDGYTPNDALLAAHRDHFQQLAKAVGKQSRATEVLRAYGQKVADAKQKLAGRAGTAVTLAQGFSVNGQPVIRAYTDHAQAVQVLESIGLANAWHGKDSDPSGFTTVGVEGLTAVSNSTLLYVAQPADNPFTGALAGNATWRSLGFVSGGRVHALAAGTWFWGGPLSDELLIDQALKALGA
jgi:ABC-type Fe3+-hydroxamate transport system substrate-binding protein